MVGTDADRSTTGVFFFNDYKHFDTGYLLHYYDG